MRLRPEAVEILGRFVTAVGRAFVYIHFYSGDMAAEEVGVHGERTEELEQLGRKNLPVDMLLQFRARSVGVPGAAKHRRWAG